MVFILVIYYSQFGATEKMAMMIAQGIDSVAGVEARIRTVPPVAPITTAIAPSIPEKGAIYASMQDLQECSGIILGSPARFGNMAAPLKYFLDTTSSIWQSGALIGKPAGCFTSSSSLHGGQEVTLLNMMIPLLHHGAIIVGLPYSETDLMTTTRGGTPYGPSHLNESRSALLSEAEKRLCIALGKRIANLAIKLRN